MHLLDALLDCLVVSSLYCIGVLVVLSLILADERLFNLVLLEDVRLERVKKGSELDPCDIVLLQ